MFHVTVTVIAHVHWYGSTSEQRAEASHILDTMLLFKFALFLHLMEDILGLTHDLFQVLQRKDLDIINATNLLDETVMSIKGKRMDDYSTLFDKVSCFCQTHHIEIPVMDVIYV